MASTACYRLMKWRVPRNIIGVYPRALSANLADREFNFYLNTNTIMKPKEIIKKYEKKKADNFKMIESAKGYDAQVNIQWLYRINELFDGFIDDVKKLNEGMRK
jgi:hypothetical protein